MKVLISLAILILIAWGVYGYINDPTSHITVSGNSVMVDAGDFTAELSVTGDYKNTYMLFGGEYFKNKNLVNPIVLSGLEIDDAKSIYSRYPDFHLCKSPGAPLAQPKVKPLYLIPADESVFKELMNSIKSHEKNFASGEERICVVLSGKALTLLSDEFPGTDSTKDIKKTYRVSPGQYYLINSAKIVQCKDLLDSI
jgi:hypothetical protein